MPGRRRARPAPGAMVVAASPWIVIGLGVAVLVVLLVVAFLAMPQRGAPVSLPPRVPLPSTPSTPAEPATGPTGSPTPGGGARTSSPATDGPRGATATPAPTRAAPSPGATAIVPLPPSTTSPSPRPPVAPAGSGQYRLVTAFTDGFIGEVSIRNTTTVTAGWTVRLTLAQGRLVTSWVDGGAQGSVTRSGGVHVFTSGADLAPGAAVTLRFHFDQTGSARPTACAVNGTGCTGL